MSETSVANDTSGLVPQRQKASDYDNPDPAPELQNVFPLADLTVPLQQELDLLFGPLYDEFFNAGTSRVNKSSSPTIILLQRHNPSTNYITTSEPSTLQMFLLRKTNENQAGISNLFCTPVTRRCYSSSLILPVQTRRQLTTDPEMCMFALTVSTAEPKNIKEAMADSAWIEYSGYGKTKKDEDQTVNSQQSRLVERVMLRKGLFSILSVMDVENGILNGPLKEEVYVAQTRRDSLILIIQTKLPSKDFRSAHPTAVIFINQAKYTLEILKKHGMEKGQSIGTIHMGLWYPKGSGFDLTAFSDADHAGCIDTRKSTSGGIQFLGDKLVSWMSKKQDCIAMSSAEAECVALSASCAQVM
ncbi:hypothetical protein Tco_0210504 [Tanacetum coccineum]